MANRTGTSSNALGRQVAWYDWEDEDGEVLYQSVRFEPKDFRYRRRPVESDPPEKIRRGGWVWSLSYYGPDGQPLGGVRRVLYRLPELTYGLGIGADIYLGEGEKDVGALESAGAVATCNVMGAGKWRDEYVWPFVFAVELDHRDFQIIVVVDRDEAGYKHAQDILESFSRNGLRERLRFVQAREGKDAHDHIVEYGHGLFDFEPVEVQPRASRVRQERPRVVFNGSAPDPSFMVRWGLLRAKEVGSRNRAAFDLGQQLNDNRFSRTEAWAIGLEYLERANEELPNGVPLTESEVREAFRQAYSHPPREPWKRRTRTHAVDWSAPASTRASHDAEGWS